MQGYFRQYLDQDGWQQENYPQTDIYNLPVERIKDVSGNDLRISIQGPEGPIHAIIWKIMVGRIPLYLLDTNILDNTPVSREITSRLYAGDNKIRLAQEMLLGIGGMKALAAMEVKTKVLHLNEGHCAFAGLQRIAQTMSDNGLDLKTTLEIIPRTTVFTTHTPVAAGHDEFAVDLVKPYLMPFEEKLGISVDEILSWGQPRGRQKPMHRYRCLIWHCICLPIVTGSASCMAPWRAACGPSSGPSEPRKRYPYLMSPTESIYHRLFPRNLPIFSIVIWDPIGFWLPANLK